jgi:small subunit ribosomal protein S1
MSTSFIDVSENEENVSFADMLEESSVETRTLEPGEKIEAEIVRISNEWIFIDLGGKSEGHLAKSELLDSENNISVKEGDSITVFLLSDNNNEKLFTTKISGAAAQAHLEQAYHNKIPIEGHVVKEVKGGFEIKLGSIRGFCPYSQMSLRRLENAGAEVGKDISFLIIEYKENGKNIILSHRRLLEIEQEQKKEALKETLEVGMTVKGIITSIRDFGAFVDIGGLEGLIPISEISWGRVEDLHQILNLDQEVELSIMKLDWDNDRFSFSLKATLPDPWDILQLKEGETRSGTVVRLTKFGAFITLEPGVDGLLHISNMGGGRKINHPKEVVSLNESVEIRVDAIDLEDKRISLSMVGVATQEEVKNNKTKEEQGDIKNYQNTVNQKKGSGMTLGDLLKARGQKL